MFLLFGYSIQNFLICYFYCQKTAFICKFQHTPLWKLMIFSKFCVGMSFCGHLPNSPRNKNLKRHNPYLLNKVVFFGPQKTIVPFWQGPKKLCQMIRNERVRSGRHIDMEVSYKILWFKIPKLVLILHYLSYFQKGLFGGNFEQKHPWVLQELN